MKTTTKHKLFYLFFSFLLFHSVLFSQWQQSQFIIGAFVGPNLQDVTDAVAIQRFQQVKDAHFNLIVYPYQVFDHQYPNGTMFTEAYNDRSISIASQVGINYMVNDSRHMPATSWSLYSPPNQPSTFDATTANQLVNHYKGLSTQGAMYGYHLKDEPAPSTINPSHLTFLRNYIYYIRTNHNQKLAYINMVPYYGFTNKNAYESYLDEYLLNGSTNQNPQAFGFDYYLENNPISSTNFFYNLSIIRTKAQGRPFWAYPRISPTISRPEPDNSYIRFSVFSALAYGAKGIIYYHYETIIDARTQYSGLATNGTTTSKYPWVQNINSYIEQVIGPAIMSSHCIGTYHQDNFKDLNGNTIETIPISSKIDSSHFVISMASSTSTKGMVGEFFDDVNNYIYLLVVNKGYQDSFSASTYTIQLPGYLSGKIFTTPVGGFGWSVQVSTSFQNNSTIFNTSTLLPGEGRLYRITNSGLGRWDLIVPQLIYGDVTNIPVPADYDGDGKTDLAIKNSLGQWEIDYTSDGFGVWNATYSGYGDATNIPVPADYDGDGKADLAVKNSLGQWKIDCANNGFGSIDITYTGYGDATNHPVPADYDGDHKADLSIKNDAGYWKIDYSNNNGFGSFDFTTSQYGGSDAHPVPADYDGDGKADLSIKADWGSWYINYAVDGFSSGWNKIVTGYGDATNIPVPADFDGDHKADLSVKNSAGEWKVDFAKNEFTGFDDLNYAYGSTDAHPVVGDFNGDGRSDFSIKADWCQWFIDYAGFKKYYLNKQNGNNTENVSNTIISDKYIIAESYPNPFNPETKIQYQLNNPGVVTIKVFDILGREIQTLINEYKNAGAYSVLFNGNTLSSGIYLYIITQDNHYFTGKMSLMK